MVGRATARLSASTGSPNLRARQWPGKLLLVLAPYVLGRARHSVRAGFCLSPAEPPLKYRSYVLRPKLSRRLPSRCPTSPGKLRGKWLRACFEIRSGPAAGDFGCGQATSSIARLERPSPQWAVRNEPTQATGKRLAARRGFAQKARWLRCASVTAPWQGSSLVAPRHRAFCAKTGPLLISKQALNEFLVIRSGRPYARNRTAD